MRPLDPRLRPYLRRASAALTGVVAAGVVGSVLLLAQLFAVAHLVVVLVEGGHRSEVLDAGLLVLAATCARALASYAGDACAARASAQVTRDLRHRLVRAALDGGGDGTSRQGELALLLTRGTVAVDPYLTRYLPALVLAVVLPPLALLAIASQDLLAAGIVAVTLPLVPVFAVLVGLATRDRAQGSWRALASLAGHFVDVVHGLPTLVSYQRARPQSATIRSVTDRYRRATLDTLRLAFASSAVLELVATLSVAVVAVVVGLRLATGSLDLGTALVVLLLAPEAYWPLRRVGAEFHAAAEGSATFEKVDVLLTPVPHRGSGPVPVGPVTLDGVTVTYPGRSTPALEVPRLEVRPYTLTAVRGPSGSGKSTLLDLLAGLREPDTGEVAVHGVPRRPEGLDRWRAAVAWVPQRPWLVAGSIADNVRLGSPDATDDEVRDALDRVGLRPAVSALEHGADTVLGEDGEGLSAGQRARLALARAVLAQRPLVLVDEPSAHLDAATEQVVADTLRWLARRSTVVVVTHSPALLEHADAVVTLAAPAPRRTVPAPRPAARPAPPAPAEPLPDDAVAPHGGVDTSLLLGVLASAAGIGLTVTSAWLITRAAAHPPVLFLMVAIVAVRTFGIARPVLRYGERLVGHDAALRMLTDRRVAVFESIVPLTPGRLGRRRGEVLSGVVDDVDALLDQQLRVRAPLSSFAVLAVPAVLATALLSRSAGAALAVALVVAAAAGLAVHRRVAGVEADLVRARGVLSGRVLEAVQGTRELAMWQGAGRAVAAVDASSRLLADATERSARTVAAGRAVVVAALGAAVAAVAVACSAAVATGTLAGPVAAALVLLPLAMLEVALAVPDAGALAVRTRAAAARLDALAATRPAVEGPDHPRPLPTDPGVLDARGLSAGWAGPAVLEDVSLEVSRGHHVGVTGPSGSGKSTLAAVLVRFLDPSAGAVRMDGCDLRTLDADDVRRAVGLVDDDPYVFSSTVFENLRLAAPAAGRADVGLALRAVRLGEWLDGLPDGLDTFVGDGHSAVSGGERARLGLARALLADKPFLVLDEPTAHLDTATAREVAEDLLAACQDRALVWITHDGVGLDRMHDVVDLDRSPAMSRT